MCPIHKALVLVFSQLNSPQRSKHSVPWLATEVLNIVHQSSMETHRIKQLNTRPYSRLKRKGKLLTTDNVYHHKNLEVDIAQISDNSSLLATYHHSVTQIIFMLQIIMHI